MNTTPASRKSLPDLIFGLAMLAIAIVVWLEAGELPPSPYDPLGPGAFPKALSGALALLSIVVIGRVAVRKEIGRSETSLVFGVGDDTRVPLRKYFLALGLGLATALYAALLTLTSANFLLVTIAYITVLGIALSRRTRGDVAKALVVGMALGIALDALFTKVLLITLP